MRNVASAYNIDDLAKLAKRRLPSGLYEFIDRGAEDEITRAENSSAIKRVLIRQRIGIDVSKRQCSTTVLGTTMSMPVAHGVTGLVGMLWHKADWKIASACAEAGVPYTVGSGNFAPLSELKDICGDLLWRQLYPPRTPELLQHQLRITREAGVRVLIITLDSPITGNREYMMHNGFLPGMLNRRAIVDMLTSPRWLMGTMGRYMLEGGMPEFSDMPEGNRAFLGKRTTRLSAPADNYSWKIIRQIRQEWKGMLVIKGVSCAEDARTAAKSGVDGIIVSNHGGRSLDGCVASMAVLPEIVDAVGSQMSVMVDGGFKRGVDVLKAIAIGASAVMVGRATVFGLAAGGEAGVARALAIFRSEIDRGQAMMGATSIDQLDRGMLQYSDGRPV